MSKTAFRTLQASLAVGTTAGLMILGVAAASAHVDISPDSAIANSESVLTFSVPHGCNGSDTTKIAISLPMELNDATPTVNPNWTISKTIEKLATPQKLANGTSVTQRTSTITYTAKTPLDAHQRDTFALAVVMPDTAGKTIYFPTLQTCIKGQTEWNNIAKPGQDPETLNAPSPSVAVTAETPDDASAVAARSDSPNQTPGYLGLGAGVLGLALGGWALARTRRLTSAAKAG